jgi:uncharacterized Fe-S cluster-containing radical SAM superfamily protein
MPDHRKPTEQYDHRGKKLTNNSPESSLIDPITLAAFTDKDVCDGDLRKYYRFRPSLFFGGIATADCVGCCLRCVFCWAWNIISRPQECGTFTHPDGVAQRLMRIAETKHFRQVRISGNEPTIGWEHLMKVPDLGRKVSLHAQNKRHPHRCK